MKHYDVVLFDLDGTIIDSGKGVLNAVKYALRHYGDPIPEMEELRKFMGPPLKESFMEVCGYDEKKAVEAIDVYREYYREIGIHENEVYEGMAELIADLKADGRCVIVATSKPEEFAKLILGELGISEHFTYIAGADMAETRAEKEQVLEYALKENGIVDHSQVVMVGDRKFDINGAHAFGLDSVGVLFGYGSREEFEAAGATYIVETASELRKLLGLR